jgi:two-component sensor histidine kinase
MLRLQAGDDPHLSQRLQEASSRIMAIGRAHDRLYRSPQVEKIEMSGYLSDICEDLKQVTPNCDILFDASAQVVVNTDQAINLALVVTELVTNAAKHAYPNDTRGPIRVRFGRADGNAARISIRDEGLGLAPEFDVTKGNGFGMRLVRALTKQAHGQLRIERHPRGTEFILDIPVDG